MSKFIHISEKTSPWRGMLRAALVITPLLGAAWYGLSDDGLPITPEAARPAPPVAVASPRPTLLPDPAEAHASADPALASLHPALHRTDDADSPDAPDDEDYGARNANVDIQRLTQKRPLAARAFLSEVLLASSTSAGYVVTEVLPESRYERMGLRPGDVIYTLDTPRMAAVDEGSMVALMQQTEIELEVYRQGTLLRLRANLADDGESTDADRR